MAVMYGKRTEKGRKSTRSKRAEIKERLNMTYGAHELLWVVTGVRFRKEITEFGDECKASLHGQSSTRSTLQHSPQRLMSVTWINWERCQWSAVPFFDGHTSAAVVTVMLICVCEPLPSILSGVLFCLGVAFEACDALFDICTAVHEITVLDRLLRSSKDVQNNLGISDTRTRRARHRASGSRRSFRRAAVAVPRRLSEHEGEVGLCNHFRRDQHR